MRLGKFYITKETALRIAVLFIALVNQFLVAFGISPVPFTSAEIEAFLSTLFTVIATLWATWKNNDVTPEAHKATAHMNALKAKNKRKEGDK